MPLWQVLVAGQENIELFSLDQLQQLAVLDSAPPHSGDGANVVIRECKRKGMRYVFVE